ncbi:uncharacterized protein HKW66_Vig0125510 [Vigna angularis]|uniref:Uncharacterized protein n=1 Tax=Phaseolus angularis TaxID=3914 RepID=A0A8T0K403_PHAAN|nr:uncharacterized protein HKW66_Vig0125510 [Vigna angularis]
MTPFRKGKMRPPFNFLGLQFQAIDDCGNKLPSIWVLAKNNVKCDVIGYDAQFIALRVQCENCSVFIVGFYGAILYTKCRILWSSLGSLQQRLLGSCVVFGDFHAIISNEEKKAGIRPHRSHAKNFIVG